MRRVQTSFRAIILAWLFFFFIAQISEAAHFNGVTYTPVVVDFIGNITINGVDIA